MRKRVRFYVAAMLSGLGALSSVYAQTDVTDSYLVNSGFEDGDYTGWDCSPTNLSWWGVNDDGDPETKTGTYIAGIWHASIPEYEMSQTVTVPNGTYMVSCDLMVSVVSAGAVSRLTTQRLFANNNSVYYGKKTDYSEKNLIDDEVYSFAGYTETVGDKSALRTITIEQVVVTDGTLKIGIRTNGVNAEGQTGSDGRGWFKVDNFRLYSFEGTGGLLTYYRAKLNRLIGDASSLAEEMPLGEVTLLNDEIEKAREVSSNSEIEEELQVAIEGLTAAIGVAEPANEIYLELLNLLIDTYMELVELGYPGLEALEEAKDAGADMLNKEDALIADFEQAVADFNTAVTVYRFSAFEEATVTNPIDATWLVANSNIEEGTVGWTLNGFKTIGTGDNYENFAGTFIEQWVVSPNTLADYSASQTIIDLPNGIYNVSAAMIACQQSDATIIPTGACLFGNSTTVEAATENGIGVRFDLNVVVTDGTLTLGVKTVNTTANWVAFDFVQLAYMGKDITVYEAAYTEQLAKAKRFLGEELILPKDENTLRAVIAEIESADRSTIEALERVLEKLDAAIAFAEDALLSLKNFKSGSYAKVLEVAENQDGIYSEELAGLMAAFFGNVDAVLNEDTTTMAVYPVLTEQLDRYLSFVDAYHACETYASESSYGELIDMLEQTTTGQLEMVNNDEGNIEAANEVLEAYLDFATAYTACAEFGDEANYDEVKAMFNSLLTAQLQLVMEDLTKITSAKKTFTSFISFSKTFILGMDCAYDETYPEDKRALLLNECEAERKRVEADYAYAPEAEFRLMQLIADTRFDGMVAGEETDVTSMVIINSIVDAPDNATCPIGWEVDLGNGSNYTYSTGHWSGETVNHFFDSYNGTAGALKYTAKQVLKGIANGTYKLVAAARTDGVGAHVFVNVIDGLKLVEIPVYGDTGGEIWRDADEESELKQVNDGKGYGWSWVEIDGINVNNNTMTIGCSSTLAYGTPWAGLYFSVDDFQLFWVSADYSIGVEDLEPDSVSKLAAYATNGYIVVEGAEEYSIFTTEGSRVSVHAQLPSGIYIVKSGSEAVKVVVQ